MLFIECILSASGKTSNYTYEQVQIFWKNYSKFQCEVQPYILQKSLSNFVLVEICSETFQEQIFISWTMYLDIFISTKFLNNSWNIMYSAVCNCASRKIFYSLLVF